MYPPSPTRPSSSSSSFSLGFHRIFLALALLASVWSQLSANEIRPSCSRDESVCEIYLEITKTTTMTHTLEEEGVGGRRRSELSRVSVAANGTIYVHPKRGKKRPLTQEEISNIAFGDGSYKRVFLYNNSLPGPPIVVYEGQQVVVKLKNAMTEEGTSLHFHGAYQKDTPWMDGVAGVSQCPVLPGETFTYRFLASPAGSYWYHSHYGTQRTMGAAGAFIVLDRDEKLYRERRGNSPVPTFAKEFYMITQDWMRESSADIGLKLKFDVIRFPYDFDTENCYISTKQLDGVDSGVIPFVSAILNGKGRYRGQDIRYKEPTFVPYDVFKVKKGGFYRFRVIAAAMLFPFRISIDHHKIYLIATDGMEMKTQPMDAIIIFNGERYDFFINATDPLKIGNYWIRMETLEITQDGKTIDPRGVKGVLRYDGAPTVEPASTSQPCTDEMPCQIYNCPYSVLPPEDHWTCHPLTSLSRTKPEPMLAPSPGEELVEHFLNFHFSFSVPGVTEKPTINGIQHKLSVASPMTFPRSRDAHLAQCDKDSCETGLCRNCDHRIYLPLNKIVQLNFAVTVNNPPDVINGNDHPVHIHGRHVQILKIAYPTYDPVTYAYKNRSSDFRCTAPDCNTLVWSNKSWYGGNVPGLKQEGAPWKDSFVVPVGGYAVTRFRTENSGYWFVHCHVEFHNAEGMALILQVGNESEMNDKPRNMRTCGDFSWPANFNMSTNDTLCDSDSIQVRNYKIATAVLACACIFGLFSIAFFSCQTQLMAE